MDNIQLCTTTLVMFNKLCTCPESYRDVKIGSIPSLTITIQLLMNLNPIWYSRQVTQVFFITGPFILNT
jgi:hypothetical protein